MTADIQDIDPMTILMIEGHQLGEAAARRIENSLSSLDLTRQIEYRIRLLAFYFTRTGNEEFCASRLKHIAWFVRNFPDHPISASPLVHVHKLSDGPERYELIRLAWLEQVAKPKIGVAALVAASSFLSRCNIDEAIGCLERAQSLCANDEIVIELQRLRARRKMLLANS